MDHQTPKYDTCFFERYAMASLAALMGERYAHLVNRDRPDLQDRNLGIGIEVTRAIREDKDVANALINEMAGEDVREVDEYNLLNINRTGYAYGLGSGQWMGKNEYEYWALALPMKRILESKIRKVNNGFYGNFREFGLYIFTKEDVESEELVKTMNYAMKLQEGLAKSYDTLFISQIQSMYVCDLRNGTFDIFDIDENLRQLFYDKAVNS